MLYMATRMLGMWDTSPSALIRSPNSRCFAPAPSPLPLPIAAPTLTVAGVLTFELVFGREREREGILITVSLKATLRWRFFPPHQGATKLQLRLSHSPELSFEGWRETEP